MKLFTILLFDSSGPDWPLLVLVLKRSYYKAQRLQLRQKRLQPRPWCRVLFQFDLNLLDLSESCVCCKELDLVVNRVDSKIFKFFKTLLYFTYCF